MVLAVSGLKMGIIWYFKIIYDQKDYNDADFMEIIVMFGLYLYIAIRNGAEFRMIK